MNATALVRTATLPIRWIDRALLAHYGIFEYSDDPQCVLRAGLTKSPAAVTLQDGTSIARGETVAELHLWSQRSMAVRNGIELRRRVAKSFHQFANFARADARFAPLRGVLVRTSVCDQFPRALLEKLSARWGWEVDDQPRSAGGRFADFWDNFYIVLLGLAYPSGPIHFRRRIERIRVWISMRRL
ncbi:MAG TPA: hypothetical protein VI391_02115, partial [Thermoanaerobaculia bacterium]